MPWDEGAQLCAWPRFSPGGCGSWGVLCELPLPTSFAVVSQAKGVRRTWLRNCESPWRRTPAWGDVMPQALPALCKGPLMHCRQVPQLSSRTLGSTESKSNVSSNQSFCPVTFAGLLRGYDFPRKQLFLSPETGIAPIQSGHNPSDGLHVRMSPGLRGVLAFVTTNPPACQMFAFIRQKSCYSID